MTCMECGGPVVKAFTLCELCKPLYADPPKLGDTINDNQGAASETDRDGDAA